MRQSYPFMLWLQLSLLMAVAAGCSRPEPDAALTRVAGLVSEDPKAALSMLDSVDTRQLPDADRHCLYVSAVRRYWF